MTQHSSLKSASVHVRHRNVLKRYERVRALQSADAWGDRQSVYKLPKQKLIKLKVKKEKSAKEAEASPCGTAPSEGVQKPQTPQAGDKAPKAPEAKPKSKEKGSK